MSGEKLKYHVLHRGRPTHHVISRMRNDDSTLCLWAHEVWVPKNVPPIGNGQCRVEWSRDRWKVKVVTQICLVLSKPWVKLVRKPKPQWKWHTEWTMSSDKLKYHVLHRGTHHVISRMRNDDSTVSMSTWSLGSKECTTNRKWPMPSRMVTWPMKGQGRDPKCLVVSKPWVKLVRKPKPVLGTSTRTRINVNVAQFNSAFICLLLAGALISFSSILWPVKYPTSYAHNIDNLT